MTSWRTVKRVLRATAITASLLTSGLAQAAIPASWNDTGFSIDSTGMTLTDVIEEFGRVYGVRVAISLEREAMMKGRLRASNGIEFLNRLAQPYKFRWFVYSDTLYIVPRDDNASMRLEVGEDAVQDAKQALIGVGLFDSRFGWGELPDEGIVIVSGPREYVNLARSILLPEEKKIPLKDRQVMVFRLKYASATDRVITTRGRTETIPGIKTILSKLLFGPDSAERVSSARSRLDVSTGKRSRLPEVRRGEAREVAGGLFGIGGASPPADAGEEATAGNGGREARESGPQRPRIEADPTLNAIIVYDVGSKRAMYEQLIAELDIEPQQVEIEALILDIDRSKLSELGVEWGVRNANGQSGITMNAGRKESGGIDLPLPGSTLLINNAARFYARLKAMQGTGEARVLATPTVLTLDNVAAVLDLSQTRYMPLLAERYADLADVTAGTMLRVIPRIVRDPVATRVRLEVDIEDGALGDPGNGTNVTRSTISTQAIVDLQQTLVIGGYHAESLSKNREKVPVLGDVPVMGGLFRNENESHSSRERLFLITPRLVGSAGVPAERYSRVVQRRASSIARASGALDSGRPVDVRDVYGDPAPQAAERNAPPAPAFPARGGDTAAASPAVPLAPPVAADIRQSKAAASPRSDAAIPSSAGKPADTSANMLSRLDVAPARIGAPPRAQQGDAPGDAAPRAAIAPQPPAQPAQRAAPAVAAAAPAVAAGSGRAEPAPRPSREQAPAAAPRGSRFDSDTYQAAMQALRGAKAPSVAAATTAPAPLTSAQAPAASDVRVSRTEPAPLPAPSAPKVEPDPALAALIIAESRTPQALQSQALAGNAKTDRQASLRISGPNDLTMTGVTR